MGEKVSFIKRPGVQTLLASVLCAVLGILLGFIILWFMNAEHAGEGTFLLVKIIVLKNRFNVYHI